MQEEPENYHTVSVPEGALPRVYAVISEYLNRSAGTPTDTKNEQEAWDVPGNGRWSRGNLEELYAKFTNPAGRAMLQAVAQASLDERDVSYRELREAADAVEEDEFNFNKVRAQLSWFAKYCKSIKGENVWPMRVIEGDADAGTGERYHYRMRPEIAQAWLEIAAQDDR